MSADCAATARLVVQGPSALHAAAHHYRRDLRSGAWPANCVSGMTTGIRYATTTTSHYHRHRSPHRAHRAGRPARPGHVIRDACVQTRSEVAAEPDASLLTARPACRSSASTAAGTENLEPNRAPVHPCTCAPVNLCTCAPVHLFRVCSDRLENPPGAAARQIELGRAGARRSRATVEQTWRAGCAPSRRSAPRAGTDAGLGDDVRCGARADHC